jgi:hypothetical protein
VYFNVNDKSAGLEELERTSVTLSPIDTEFAAVAVPVAGVLDTDTAEMPVTLVLPIFTAAVTVPDAVAMISVLIV